MAISFVAAASGSSNPGTTAVLTLPATLQGGDAVLINCQSVTLTSVLPTITISTGGGTAAIQAITPATATESAPATVTGNVWYFIAAGTVGSASSDASRVVTVTSSASAYMSVTAAAYRGTSTTPIDVITSTATAGGNASSVTYPAATTAAANDWGVYIAGGALEGGATFPGTLTARVDVNGGSSVISDIRDSNGSVGAGGTVLNGGTVTIGNSANSIATAFTIGLAPLGSATNINVSDFAAEVESVNVTSNTVSIVNTNLGYVVQNVPVRRWMLASGGTPPYTWTISSGAMPAGMTLSSSGAIAGTPTVTGTATAVFHVADSASNTATASLPINCISAPFSAGSPTTDGNGVITYQVTSAINTDSTGLTVRVLNPTVPSGAYPHGFIFTLPVNQGTDDTSFGNGLDTIRTLGLHNTYNLSVIEISSGGNWFGDNPTNSAIQQETYMLQVVAWAHATYGTGGEKNWLIGFSRSGIGGQGMFLHRPDLYAGVASWDFPATMNTYAGGDPNGTVGGNSANTYGTADNFTANYQLSASNLAIWSAGQNFSTVNRMWIGGYFSFQADVTQYDPILTTAGILHTTNLVSESEHNWAPTPGWVGLAIPALLGPANVSVSDFAGQVESRNIGAVATLTDNAAAVEYLLNPSAAQTTINRTGIVLVAAHYQPVF